MGFIAAQYWQLPPIISDINHLSTKHNEKT